MGIAGFVAGSIVGGITGIIMMCLAIAAKREDEQFEKLHLNIQINMDRCIRFCDSRKKELFCLPDGASLKLICGTGDSQTSLCHYLDEEHMLIDGRKWSRQEFAEQMEKRGICFAPLTDFAER